jgi:DNA-binding MarR family transcriptional regulator
MKTYNFKIHTNITKAMSKYNKMMPGQRFNTMDAVILNLVKSFFESNTKFYISNKELGDIMVADPSTVQRSIDRLIAAKLIAKEIVYVGQKPQRLLSYKPEAVNELFELY